MSFDIFLCVLTKDEKDWIDRSTVERAFKGITVDQEGDRWHLQTPAGERLFGTIRVDDQPRISDLAVNRPPSYSGFPEFWNAMFEVMVQTRTILFWPGHGPHPQCCIANPDMRRDLPANLVEAIGEATLVASGAEIYAAIDISAY